MTDKEHSVVFVIESMRVLFVFLERSRYEII